jgi:hypothetical protein
MKKNLFIYSILILSISFMNAQDTTTFDNVVIGTSGPAYGVKIKANFPGGNGGWARSFSISNQNGDQNFISIGTVGLITNGITTGDRSFIGRAYDETYMNFLPNGNVGIGTTNPLAKFVVNASTEGQTVPIKSISIIGPNQPGNQNSAQDLSWDFNSAGSAIIRSYRGGNWDTTLQFLTNSYNGGNAPRVNMHISSEGLVGIGTANPGYKLDVIGTVRAREVKVDLLGADFVFEDGYKLMPLNEVEKFVKQNKHLPEIAPAKEMQENGSNLGSLSVQLLQKIEELTLHVIEQNKKMDLQNQEINLLKENMKKLQQK